MTPVSRYGSTPSGVTIRTSSPTSRPASSTVSASITTSSPACGGSPVRSNGVTSGSHELPIVGAPPPEITSSVCGSITCAKPPTLPSAAATPGNAWTSSRTASGIGFRSWPPPPPPPAATSWNAFSACTTTSVFAKMSPKRSSNAESAVSVRTRVPATNPTPRTIASAVSASRSFLATRLFSAARHISDFQQLHPVEDLLGRRIPHLVHDLAVGEEHDPVGVGGAGRVVSDHHDRLSVVGHRCLEECEQLS